jgi:hypothetical protein
MKRLLLALLIFPTLTLAASPFDGTWVADLGASKLPDTPDSHVLTQGWYDCQSCAPPIRVKADGTDQAVKGHEYFDSIAVQVIDPHSVKVTSKKAGKVTYVESYVISADGNSLTNSWEDHTESTPVTGKTLSVRTAPTPAGAHPFSGSWKMTKIESVSNNGTTVTLHVTDKGVSMKDGNGVGYDAQFDGKEYPIAGDLEKTLVTVKRIDARTFEESEKRAGKVASFARVGVSPDGKTLNWAMEDRNTGMKQAFTLYKQ